jgi:hypothetical protein
MPTRKNEPWKNKTVSELSEKERRWLKAVTAPQLLKARMTQDWPEDKARNLTKLWKELNIEPWTHPEKWEQLTMNELKVGQRVLEGIRRRHDR